MRNKNFQQVFSMSVGGRLCSALFVALEEKVSPGKKVKTEKEF